MRQKTTLFLLLLVSVPALAWADIELDGIDDRADTGLAFSVFASASDVTLELVFRPLGSATSADPGTDFCYLGERLFGNYDAGGASTMSLSRNGDMGAGADRLCVWSTADGATEEKVVTTYTTGVFTHLVATKTGGQLSLYKDGALVGSVASGPLSDVFPQLNVGQGDLGGQVPGEGVVALARIYPVALTAAQVAAWGKSALRRISSVAASGAWNFDNCAVGASGQGVAFRDSTGNGRVMTGVNGDNGTGLTCLGSSYLSEPWGAY
jgi:hypothetical protein